MPTPEIRSELLGTTRGTVIFVPLRLEQSFRPRGWHGRTMSTRSRTDDRGSDKQIISFQISRDLLEELDQSAESRGHNRSEEIRSLIYNQLEESEQ
jgi:hypothetical protein